MKIFLILSFFYSVSSYSQKIVPIETLHFKIRPGEVRVVEFPLRNDNVKLICREDEIKFARKDKVGRAIIVESYFSDEKPFLCRVESDNETYYQLEFSVESRTFKEEKLKVDPKRVKLSPENEKRAWEEQQVLNRIYASSAKEFLFTTPFIQPMSSLVTSVYGIKRVYNKEKKGQHLGIDYRAAIGENVPATNSGNVVFAGDLFYTGWTVIIDHGLDIFTVYGHLSKTLVKAGQRVEKGELIGLSGNTGRSSGPHLHWGVKVQGQYIDGFVLIDETKRYFQ
ncbi:MAG: M23 family metallopeptidase [Bacteriovoracaceae bacterium]